MQGDRDLKTYGELAKELLGKIEAIVGNILKEEKTVQMQIQWRRAKLGARAVAHGHVIGAREYVAESSRKRESEVQGHFEK